MPRVVFFWEYQVSARWRVFRFDNDSVISYSRLEIPYGKKECAMKKFALVLTVLVLSAAVSFGGGEGEQSVEEETYTLQVAGVLVESHPLSQATLQWARELEDRSNGRIEVETYFAGALGDSTEVVEYVQGGTVAMTTVSTAFMSSFDEKFDIFSLPYVFRDTDHMFAALNSEFGDYIKTLLLDKGVRGLAFFDSGSRSMYTKGRPIQTPADMEGLKVRVMSAVAVDSMEALGASGVPIAWGELYTALQTGVVDAAENNPPSIITANHFEVTSDYSLTHHFRTPDYFIMSETVYKSLPEDLQQILVESVDEFFVPLQREMFEESTVESMRQIEEVGMKIHEIDDLTPFIEATADVRKNVAEEIGMADWLEIIESM
jgi:tripartite ATP-independent transporter DctP family solute receptor